MRALTFQGIEKVAVAEVPDPKILFPDDVIVKVKVAGICGSDLHVYHGREKGIDPGTVMGHELAGEVVACGPAVRKFKEGDLVFCPFSTNCGRCYFCTIGLTSRCTGGQLFGWVEKGTGLEGVQAEYARVPLADSTLCHVPESIELEEALFMGDILSTGFYCADMAEVSARGTYVVIGCGPVGIMCIIGALERGAEKVYAIDPDENRRAVAKTYGAIPLDDSAEGVKEKLLSVTDGRGADAVLEAVGNPAAARLSYDIVRPGGIISVCGVHTSNIFQFSPVEAYNKNLTYRVGRCPARVYMERLVPLLQQRKLNLSRLVSHRMGLDRAEEGYVLFANRLENCTKVVLTP